MPAIAHQNKILGNTSGGGSTILVTTSESTLYGQTVTLSDGTTTLTGTFSNAGECEFTGVMMVGTLTATSGTASTSINVPYFGVYSIILSLFSATITVTFGGGTCTCVGNGESYTASSSPYTFTVHGAATYTITNTIDGVSKTDTVTITTDGQSESVTISFGTINVTYDNAFRGTSITCVQSGTTITKTAPSGGNSMVFYPPTTGNWVISGTVSGTSYSKTANVTSLSTSVSVSLETVPDGKTTTPTDDIEKWLQCGQITGKSYTTLSQVLADAETYERLLSDSNACDYMARSTTWALAEGQVPTMTDNTHPSGEASATSYVASGYEAYKAFDGDNSTGWNPADGAYGSVYIGYTFDTPKVIRGFYLKQQGELKTCRLVGSNDGFATMTPIADDISVSTEGFYYATNNTAYSSVGIVLLSGNAPRMLSNTFYTLQFYTDADITTSQDAMMRLGKYDYACDALLADSTWASAIANSTYFESVLNVKVPTMTSNTTPSGECFASSVYSSGYEAYKAFNGDVNNGWNAQNNPSYPEYIGYTFTSKVKVSSVSLNTGGVRKVYTFKIQGTDTPNDENSWVDVSEVITTPDSNYNKVYPFVNLSDSYASHRMLIVTGITSAGALNIGELQFYGRHTAQTDIIVTAHGGDTVYYMENGSPVTLTTADSDTGIGTVDWSDLPKGAITLYSSTAKNPSDLTADYSKTVYITEYTTQIYLMPDNIGIYWYGHSDNSFGDIKTNGYTFVNHTMMNITSDTTQYIGIGAYSTYQLGGYGLTNAKTFTKIKAVFKSTTPTFDQSGGYGASLYVATSKNYSSSTVRSADSHTYTSDMQSLEIEVTEQSAYGLIHCLNARAIQLYAIWLE